MIHSARTNGRASAAATTASVSVRVDRLLLKRAEGVAQARGTTVTRLLTEYLQALADADHASAVARMQWLENPRAAYWMHLERKHG
ncbi:MAG TPA: hypothetical protein VF190_06980 [Rhodothermales bacterium]